MLMPQPVYKSVNITVQDVPTNMLPSMAQALKPTQLYKISSSLARLSVLTWTNLNFDLT